MPRELSEEMVDALHGWMDMSLEPDDFNQASELNLNRIDSLVSAATSLGLSWPREVIQALAKLGYSAAQSTKQENTLSYVRRNPAAGSNPITKVMGRGYMGNTDQNSDGVKGARRQ